MIPTGPVATLGDLRLQGVEDETGVTWHVPNDKIEGWWSSPAGTLTTTQRPRSHGAWAGDQFLTARSIAISGWCMGPTHALVEDALNRLATACSLSDTTLTVDDSTSQSATVRRSGEVLISWHDPRAAQWSIQLIAVDPRRMGDTLSATTALPSTMGGLTFPLTFPVIFDAVTVTGQVSLDNPGNMAGPVKLRIDGPVTGPIVTHVSSGKSLVFASSVTLGEDEFITVDMERHEVLANGQSSRSGWVTKRGWSSFDPGENVWSFTAASYDDAARLTVEATPAWM